MGYMSDRGFLPRDRSREWVWRSLWPRERSHQKRWSATSTSSRFWSMRASLQDCPASASGQRFWSTRSWASAASQACCGDSPRIAGLPKGRAGSIPAAAIAAFSAMSRCRLAGSGTFGAAGHC